MSGPRSFLPLSGSHRFDVVFANGTRIRRGGITIVAVARRPGPARVGLVAGRRVGGAVVRNRAKRRVRAVLDRMELADGLDVVVVATPAVATVSFSTLERWIGEAYEGVTQRLAESAGG